jgi:undecaprenyl-diphosphatase
MHGAESRVLRWIGRHERMALVALSVLAAAVWAFTELTEEALEGDTHAVDRLLLLGLRTAGDPADPIGPGWLESAVRDFSALGSVGVLALLTLLVCGYLWLRERHRTVGFLLAAVGSGFALSFALKSFFDRPRPDLVAHGTDVYTSSFPSGHAMLSAIVFMTLAALLARVQESLRLKAYLIAAGTLLTLLVGASRVYLGVHWPTDVLAGWMAGGIWALACWTIAGWLARRGTIEPQPPSGEDAPPRPGEHLDGHPHRG